MKNIIEKIQKINNSIQRKIKYKINYLRPKSLAPVKNVHNSSLTMLSKAMRDKDNLNIALTGGYGAGKSSIIKSYYAGILGFFRRKRCFKPIFISLGMLGIEFEKNEKIEKNDSYKKDVFCQEIEKSIIQQIIYKESKDRLPESQINRPYKTSFKSILNAFIILLIIFITIIIIKNNHYGIDDFFNMYKIFNLKEDFIQIQNGKMINDVYQKIIISGVSLVVLFQIAKFVRKIIKQIDKIGLKLKFGQTEIEVSKSKSESLINKYMDELVYFFSKTNYNVMVIEDLDRFLENSDIKDRVIIIFQKLKELNQVLNQSNQINRKIRFVYLVKDDLFKKSKERIKFFDVIIPVIPIVSNYNSYAELRNTFYEYEDIDDKLLQDISPFVTEKRQIINVYNEYKLYREEIYGNEIDNSKLLAMVALKNLRPNIYEELINDEGALYNLLNNRKDWINQKIENKQKRIDDNRKKIQIKEKLAFKNSKELKQAVLYHLKNLNSQYVNEPTLTEAKFLSDGIDSNYLKKNTIYIQDSDKSHYAYNEGQIFSEEGGKEVFIETLRKIEQIRDLDIEKINSENNSYNEEIKKVKLLQLKDLIDDNLTEDGFINNLLLSGYIDENYKDYMYKFLISDKFSKNDQEYMSNVRQGYLIDYECIINHPKNVIDELDEDYFLNTNVLNFDIVKELSSQKDDKKNKKREYLIENLARNDIIIQDFICKYYDHFGDKITSTLLESINKVDEESVCNLLQACPDYRDNLIKVLKKGNLEIFDNQKNMQYVKAYVERIKDYYQWCEEFNLDEKKFLLKLNPEFKDTEINNKDFANFIIENGLYFPNKFMLKQIFHYYKIDPRLVDTKVLSTIENEKRLKKVKSKIYKEKIEFLNECYFKQEKNENDINDIVSCIKNWNLPIDTINEMISNLPERIDIIDFDKNIISSILKLDKINPSLYNYYKVYQINDYTLDEALIQNIELNIDGMIKNNKNDLSEMEENDEYKHFKELIAKSDQINIEAYRKITPYLNLVLDTIISGEIDQERLKILIDNDMISFNKENFKVVCNDVPTKVGRFVQKNINKFIGMLPNIELTAEVVESILNYNIPYKEKMKIANKIELNLLNKKSLQILAQEYKKYRNYKLSDEIIDCIISSDIPRAIRIEFINKMNITKKETMDKYLKYLGGPYSYVEQYAVKPIFSVAYTDNNEELIDTLVTLHYNITILKKKKRIIIYNIKN